MTHVVLFFEANHPKLNSTHIRRTIASFQSLARSLGGTTEAPPRAFWGNSPARRGMSLIRGRLFANKWKCNHTARTAHLGACRDTLSLVRTEPSIIRSDIYANIFRTCLALLSPSNRAANPFSGCLRTQGDTGGPKIHTVLLIRKMYVCT